MVAAGAYGDETPTAAKLAMEASRGKRARVGPLPQPPARSVSTRVPPMHNRPSSPHHRAAPPSLPSPLSRSRAQPSKDRADEILPGQFQHSRRQGGPGQVPPQRLRRGRARRRSAPHRRDRRARQREDSHGGRPTRHAHRLGPGQAHVPPAERPVPSRARRTPPSRRHLSPRVRRPLDAVVSRDRLRRHRSRGARPGGGAVPSRAAAPGSNLDRDEREKPIRGDGRAGVGAARHPGTRTVAVDPRRFARRFADSFAFAFGASFSSEFLAAVSIAFPDAHRHGTVPSSSRGRDR